MNFKHIDGKWQERWESAKAFKARPAEGKDTFYCLEMYPYPSGSGLHMGHCRNYAIGDAFARYQRMKGKAVLYPMGYDSFGLPAENAAIKHKVSPKDWTDNNIRTMMGQQKALGLSYDWDRMIYSHDPDYYRWNQWIFTKLYEKGLAYRKAALANWCPSCNTVLANEQVHDGKCWRCASDVTQKDMPQWFFRITAYAEELLKDIDTLAWPERVKAMQRNWIGRSEGTRVDFTIKETGETIPVFTTRPDTLWGVMFMVFAPEHPKVMELVKGTAYEKPVREFVTQAVKDRFTRLAEDKEKEGLFIGKHAVNPVNGDVVPIYIANFVLMEYGTGFIMAVPTHDQRDFEFATKFNIPKKIVIQPDEGTMLKSGTMHHAFVDDGKLVDSGPFDGEGNRDAIPKINEWLKEQGKGEAVVQFKLRDWLISRQRYWGTPIPIIHCEACGTVPVPEKDLPVRLPEDVQFTGEGNPLESSASFTKADCPACGKPARRETDTMDTFVDSSWYFLRYCDPKNKELPFGKEASQWMPVSQYIGGIEHAVMHLLYARFFTKALRDLGLIDIDEPFHRLLCQGMVLKDGDAMSKSKGNVVDPNTIVDKYGADTARAFILFAALPEKELEWSDTGVDAVNRFLTKVYRLLEQVDQSNADTAPSPASPETDRQIRSKLHRTIARVTAHMDAFEFSLAIGAMMEFGNALHKVAGQVSSSVWNGCLSDLARLLSPIAPHMAEEMCELLGNSSADATDASTFCSLSPWPVADESKIDHAAEAGETLVDEARKDILNLLGLLKVKPKTITLILADDWKRTLCRFIQQQLTSTRDVGAIMKAAMTDADLKKHGQDVAKLLPKLVASPQKMPAVLLATEDEKKFLELANIGAEFKCDILIEVESQSGHDKRRQAMPGKPALVIA
ncbi:leucine--tRNA ligase [Candidatus Woesearchaeota archaeon CG1_02_57_44]|nr:MAG: leucine--tRNA ligase [Candidatus Woesearchaeota archaeon CG1_02_57_44]